VAFFSNDNRELRERLKVLQEISVELMTARHLHETLSLIVNKAVDLLLCDAGSLYLTASEDSLSFEVAVNRSIKFDFERSTLPLSSPALASYAYKTGEPLLIPDVYEIQAAAPYQFDERFDKSLGYRTKSVLIQPLRSSKGSTLGVLQLINRKSKKNQTWPSTDERAIARMPEFTEDDARLLQSFAGVASASIENAQLNKDIESLFEGFVTAAVHAIETRDFATRGHSERVAALTVDLAEKVSRSDDSELRHIHFNEGQLAEIRYASLLHDFGKIGVREATLLKEEKLSPLQKLQIRSRFNEFKNAAEINVLRDYLGRLMREGRAPQSLEWERCEQQIREFGLQVEEYWDLVLDLNKPTILDADRSEKLKHLASAECEGCGGEHKKLLESSEVFSLNIRKGSLTEEERREIESHVTYTYKFLSRIPWTGALSRVPDIAFAHHERLNGRGYPRGLSAEKIPDQARIMAVCDIFDALAANDRPYKPAVPVPKALAILEMQAKAGDIDSRFLKAFIEGRVYENPRFVEMQGGSSNSKKAA
jgi:HD-GYP domain-containing protein (c-di-GMP phosphodiesterase class II)